MIKGFILLMIAVIGQAYALDAVVTVLETPMFKERDRNSPVVQYLRKGDVIKVHPSLKNNSNYDYLAPEKFRNINTGTVSSLDDEFLPTLDRQGNVVYVFTEHLYVYLENQQELTQTLPAKDPTDYRLEEPLPKKYPLYNLTGLRGQFTVGTTQPYYESYPYPTDIKTKGYMSPVDINLTFMKNAPDDKHDRFFLGATFNVRSFKNSYSLFDGLLADETGLKMGIGPYVSYDAFKGEHNRLSVYGFVNVYLFNRLYITQKDTTGSADRRVYEAISIAPRIGTQYVWTNVLEGIDFLVGTSMEAEPATTFRSKSAPKQRTWWQHGAGDKFTTRTTFSLAGYLGIQSTY